MSNDSSRDCVFSPGSFRLDAVEEVCAYQDLDVSRVSLLVANLVDKSMVQLADEDLPRYRLLETLREVQSRPPCSEDERSHSQGPTRRVVSSKLPNNAHRSLARAHEATAIQTLDRDFDNLRAAHFVVYRATVISTRRCALSPDSEEYSFRCMHAEITSWADAAVALAPTPHGLTGHLSLLASPPADGSSQKVTSVGCRGRRAGHRRCPIAFFR